MSEVLRCDRCGFVEPPGTATGWVRVETLGIARSLSEPDERHFCSAQCVREWAEERERSG